MFGKMFSKTFFRRIAVSEKSRFPLLSLTQQYCSEMLTRPKDKEEVGTAFGLSKDRPPARPVFQHAAQINRCQLRIWCSSHSSFDSLPPRDKGFMLRQKGVHVWPERVQW